MNKINLLKRKIFPNYCFDYEISQQEREQDINRMDLECQMTSLECKIAITKLHTERTMKIMSEMRLETEDDNERQVYNLLEIIQEQSKLIDLCEKLVRRFND